MFSLFMDVKLMLVCYPVMKVLTSQCSAVMSYDVHIESETTVIVMMRMCLFDR